MSNNVFPPPPSYLSGRLEVPFVFDTPPPPLMSHDPPPVTNPMKGFLVGGDVRGFRSVANSGPPVGGTPNILQMSYFTSPAQLKKETDDLARKQEEFILRCQYPKRILPSEMKTESSKRTYYSLRRRDRSPSPPGVEIHRRDRGKSTGGGGGGHRGYRSYSKSPPDWGRRERRAGGRRTEDRSQSRSPPPQHYSHVHSPGGANSPHPSPPPPLPSAPSSAHRSK